MAGPSRPFSLSQARTDTCLPSKPPFSPRVYLPDSELPAPWLTLLASPAMGSTVFEAFHAAITQPSQERGILIIGHSLQVISEVISQGCTAKYKVQSTYQLILVIDDAKHVRGFN